jgi:hypothetical protein
MMSGSNVDLFNIFKRRNNGINRGVHNDTNQNSTKQEHNIKHKTTTSQPKNAWDTLLICLNNPRYNYLDDLIQYHILI